MISNYGQNIASYYGSWTFFDVNTLFTNKFCRSLKKNDSARSHSLISTYTYNEHQPIEQIVHRQPPWRAHFSYPPDITLFSTHKLFCQNKKKRYSLENFSDCTLKLSQFKETLFYAVFCLIEFIKKLTTWRLIEHCTRPIQVGGLFICFSLFFLFICVLSVLIRVDDDYFYIIFWGTSDIMLNVLVLWI